MTKFIGTKHNILDGNTEGELILTRSQELPQDFLDGIKAARDASTAAPIGDMMYVGTIPEVVVEKWMAEGFDILNNDGISFAEIVAKLKSDGLDGLIGTNRRV
jgi:hypothetical protein